MKYDDPKILFLVFISHRLDITKQGGGNKFNAML